MTSVICILLDSLWYNYLMLLLFLQTIFNIPCSNCWIRATNAAFSVDCTSITERKKKKAIIKTNWFQNWNWNQKGIKNWSMVPEIKKTNGIEFRLMKEGELYFSPSWQAWSLSCFLVRLFCLFLINTYIVVCFFPLLRNVFHHPSFS